jgi:hypothetical protein
VKAIEALRFVQHRLHTAPLAQPRHGLRELHLMIELRKANHVPAAATAVAVEKVFVGIHQEAWLVVFMQRAQPHPSAATEGPRRVPILRLQIAHQGNLLFQVVESLTIHGLLASTGRIRQSAVRSQARMVGAHKKCAPMAPAFTQQHKLSSRRCAHRRKVHGSGGATDLCSAGPLAQRNRLRQCVHRPVGGSTR